jgi:hypothetical protein
MSPLTLHVLPDRLAVCRLAPDAPVPGRPVNAGFWSITHTGDELSIVLPEEGIPVGCQAEPGWRCLMVEGLLDFGLTGILASLAVPLAEAGVSIFAISTYDTDYVLVKDDDLDRAAQALSASGHRVAAWD